MPTYPTILPTISSAAKLCFFWRARQLLRRVSQGMQRRGRLLLASSNSSSNLFVQLLSLSVYVLISVCYALWVMVSSTIPLVRSLCRLTSNVPSCIFRLVWHLAYPIFAFCSWVHEPNECRWQLLLQAVASQPFLRRLVLSGFHGYAYVLRHAFDIFESPWK